MEDLVLQFSRWCSTSSVDSFEELRNLVLLEQFKQYVPSFIGTYINEHKAKTRNDAAVLADEYVLTHKPIFGDQKENDFGPKSIDRCQSSLDPVFPKQDTDYYVNDSL